MKIETEEQFNEYVWVDIPSALFHVMDTDIDDVTGAKLEEVLLLDMLSGHPELFKFKPFQWFLDTFLTKN